MPMRILTLIQLDNTTNDKYFTHHFDNDGTPNVTVRRLYMQTKIERIGNKWFYYFRENDEDDWEYVDEVEMEDDWE